MFSAYPILNYPFVINDEIVYKQVRDISRNVRIRRDAVQSYAFYDLYTVQDGETPDIIAKKVYDDEKLFYLVMLANNIYDWRNDCPLSLAQFEYYMREHYAYPYAIHHYEDVNGNIVPQDNEEQKRYRLIIHYKDEAGNKVYNTFSNYYYAGDEYEIESPAIQGMYPDVDIVMGTFGKFDKLIEVTYRYKSIKFTLVKDRYLHEENGEYSIINTTDEPYTVNKFENVNIFQYFEGTPPAGMLTVLINGEETDQPWNSITAEAGDEIEIRTNTDWMPIPNFGVTWGFHEILNRFPTFHISRYEEAVDFSKMFFNEKGSALRKIPNRLFEYNPQVLDISNMFGGCIDLTDIPEDIFVPFKMLQVAHHCFNTNSAPTNLYITSPFLRKSDVEIPISDVEEDHNQDPNSEISYDSVESFFNEIPWNRVIQHRVHVLKQEGGMTTFGAFQQLAIHYQYVRQEKQKKYGGYTILHVFYNDVFPEFRTILEADNITEIPEEDADPQAELDIIPITNWEYEERLNEAKRRIKLIKPEFVGEIVSTMKSLAS